MAIKRSYDAILRPQTVSKGLEILSSYPIALKNGLPDAPNGPPEVPNAHPGAQSGYPEALSGHPEALSGLNGSSRGSIGHPEAPKDQLAVSGPSEDPSKHVMAQSGNPSTIKAVQWPKMAIHRH